MMHTLNEQITRIDTPDGYATLRQPSQFPAFDPAWLVAHRPDAHWVMTDHDRIIRARCSLWWSATPRLPNGSSGLIGHYLAVDDDAAAVLLEKASHELVANGCTYALGPMDQNTWRDYRFVIQKGDQPVDPEVDTRGSFFLEPRNPPEWPHQFVRDGFRPVAKYFSAIVEDLSVRRPQLDQVRQRTAEQGISIRSVRNDPLEHDMRGIFAVARDAFADHLFYDRISERDFLEMYRPMRRLPTDLILVAERGSEIVGFCFAIPDLMQLEQGRPMDTVILKTLGVLPERAYAGLGQLLLEEVHQRASAMGFRRCIHALVRETPHLQRISRRYGVPSRSYALFGKELSR